MSPYAILFVLLAAGTTTLGCDKSSAPPKASPPASDAAPPTATIDAAPATATPPAGPFSLNVTAAGAVAAGAPAALTVELRDAAGARVAALDPTADKRIHVMVVSSDLSFATHAHPEAAADGTFALEVTLPSAGSYVAFADFRPAGAPPAVARGTVTVPGDAPAAKALAAKPLPAKTTVGEHEVRLRSKAPLAAGAEAVLELEVFRKGAPVADLRDYMGARGQAVLVSEDTTQYLHTHPLGGTGSKVQFHTTFAAAGKYVLWAHVRPGGEEVTARFVVDVPTEAAAPHDHGDGHGHDHGPGKGHKHGGDHGHAH